jgi:hypothetical protein
MFESHTMQAARRKQLTTEEEKTNQTDLADILDDSFHISQFFLRASTLQAGKTEIIFFPVLPAASKNDNAPDQIHFYLLLAT